MNGSVICSNCNESYDSYLEKCPKCGALNTTNNSNHVFNSSVLAPPSAKVEEPVQETFVVQEAVPEQRVSLTAIANNPTAVLDPNNMPMVNMEPVPLPVEQPNVVPEYVPTEVEENVQNLSLTEIANSHRASTDSSLTMNNMPDLDVEVHVAKPENVSLMDIANNYKPANSNMLSTSDEIVSAEVAFEPVVETPIVETPMVEANPYEPVNPNMIPDSFAAPQEVQTNQSLTDMANNYAPAKTDFLMANADPNPSVVPQGQNGSSLTDIANNYKPVNNDIFKANVSNDVFNSPVNNNIPDNNVQQQIGVPPVSQSTVVTQKELDALKEEEFTPLIKLKYVFVFLLVLAGLNFIFLFMADFNIVWLIIRLFDVGLTITGYLFTIKNNKKAGLIGLLCGIRLVLSIIQLGIIDLLLGLLTIVVSLEVIKSKK